MAEESDLIVRIPVRSIFDSFICPVCLNEITDCHITSCGHNFCEQCIRECLNRRHVCPLCNAETTQDKLVKNHHFDNLLRKVKEQKELAMTAYLDRLVKRPQHPDESSKQVAAGHSGSPIEDIYKKYTHRCLFGFEEYYSSLWTTYQQRLAELKAEYSEKFDTVAAKLSAVAASEDADNGLVPPPPPSLLRSESKEAASAELQKATAALKEAEALLKQRFDTAVSQLCTAFEGYMSSIAPSPFLLPVSCIFVVERNPKLRFETSLRPTDTIVEMKEMLQARARDAGDPIVSFGQDLSIAVVRLSALSKPGDQDSSKFEPIPSNATTVFDLKIPQGSQIVFRGTVNLQSQQQTPCFSLEFKQGADARVDYYRCKTCNLNWVCKACALSCHQQAGHEIATFMLNHKPSYGCCYCGTKNKAKCKLAGKPK